MIRSQMVTALLGGVLLCMAATEVHAAFAVKAKFLGNEGNTGINGGGVFKWDVLKYGTVNSTGLGDFDPNSFTQGDVPESYQPLAFPGFSGGVFHTFCIEINEHISPNTTYIYELTHDIASTPQDNNGAQPDGMGHLAETNLRLLFGAHFASLDTDTDYKAFQLAIWEIVQDSGMTSPGMLDLDKGTFKYTANATIKDRAEFFLANLGSIEEQNLVVLTRDGVQDQIGIVRNAPVPPTIALALSGLLPLGAAGLIRRRRQTAKVE